VSLDLKLNEESKQIKPIGTYTKPLTRPFVLIISEETVELVWMRFCTNHFSEPYET
jgi:hypothetical protein